MHRPTYPSTLIDEQGFTLIELLVAMLSSIVVIGALYAILIVTLHQETLTTDKVQADQLGRTAMTKIVEELHSSCTGFGATAIQAPSTTVSSPLAASGSFNLWFLSAYGDTGSGNASLPEVTEHDINWTSTGTSSTGLPLGKLTDYSFASTGGTSPKWTFPALSIANAKATLLATNVIPLQVSGASTAIFQYYKYNNTSTSSTFGQLEALATSEIPLVAATAEKVAKITISFTQAPTGPSETGSGADNSPCE
jgi:Tfp pilus assembly protein PilW